MADILSDTTFTGTFKTAFIKNIFASTIQAEVVNAINMILKHPGMIKSENFIAETDTIRGDGFSFTSNGEAEIYNAKKFVLLDSRPVVS